MSKVVNIGGFYVRYQKSIGNINGNAGSFLEKVWVKQKKLGVVGHRGKLAHLPHYTEYVENCSTLVASNISRDIASDEGELHSNWPHAPKQYNVTRKAPSNELAPVPQDEDQEDTQAES